MTCMTMVTSFRFTHKNNLLMQVIYTNDHFGNVFGITSSVMPGLFIYTNRNYILRA